MGIKKYKVGSDTLTEEQIKKSADANNMSISDFINESGATELSNSNDTYNIQGNELTYQQVEASAKENNMSVDDFLNEAGVKKKEDTQNSVSQDNQNRDQKSTASSLPSTPLKKASYLDFIPDEYATKEVVAKAQNIIKTSSPINAIGKLKNLKTEVDETKGIYDHKDIQSTLRDNELLNSNPKLDYNADVTQNYAEISGELNKQKISNGVIKEGEVAINTPQEHDKILALSHAQALQKEAGQRIQSIAKTSELINNDVQNDIDKYTQFLDKNLPTSTLTDWLKTKKTSLANTIANPQTNTAFLEDYSKIKKQQIQNQLQQELPPIEYEKPSSSYSGRDAAPQPTRESLAARQEVISKYDKINQGFENKISELAKYKAATQEIVKGIMDNKMPSSLEIGRQALKAVGNEDMLRADKLAKEGVPLTPIQKFTADRVGNDALKNVISVYTPLAKQGDEVASDIVKVASTLVADPMGLLNRNPEFRTQQIAEELSNELALNPEKYYGINGAASQIQKNLGLYVITDDMLTKLGKAKGIPDEWMKDLKSSDIKTANIIGATISGAIGDPVTQISGLVQRLNNRRLGYSGEAADELANRWKDKDAFFRQFYKVPTVDELQQSQTVINQDKTSPEYLMDIQNKNAGKYNIGIASVLNTIGNGAGMMAGLGYGGIATGKVLQGAGLLATEAKLGLKAEQALQAGYKATNAAEMAQASELATKYMTKAEQATQVADKVGAFTYQVITGYDRNYETGLQKFKGQENIGAKAAVYAGLYSFIESAMEQQFMPETQLIRAIEKPYDKAAINLVGKIVSNGLEALDKKTIKEGLTEIAKGIYKTGQGVLKESGEEWATNIGGILTESLLGANNDPNYNFWKEQYDTGIQTALQSFLPIGLGQMRTKSPLRENLIHHIATNPTYMMTAIKQELQDGKIDYATSQKKVQAVNTLVELNKKVPTQDVQTGKKLSLPEHVQYLNDSYKIALAEKQIADAPHDVINEQRLKTVIVNAQARQKAILESPTNINITEFGLENESEQPQNTNTESTATIQPSEVPTQPNASAEITNDNTKTQNAEVGSSDTGKVSNATTETAPKPDVFKKESTTPDDGSVTSFDQKEIERQMQPITDRMAEIEIQFQNDGYDIDWDYDNEVQITDKQGNILDVDEIPESLKKIASDYEMATQKLADYDHDSYFNSLKESRNRIKGEEVLPISEKQISEQTPTNSNEPSGLSKDENGDVLIYTEGDSNNKDKSVEELRKLPNLDEHSADVNNNATAILENIDFDNAESVRKGVSDILQTVNNKQIVPEKVEQVLSTKSKLIGSNDYYTKDYLEKYIHYSTKDFSQAKQKFTYESKNNEVHKTPEIVAKDNEGNKIGGVTTSLDPNDKNSLIILSIDIKPNYHNKGIGKNLYIELAKNNPDKTIKSSPRLSDKYAVKAWESLVRDGIAIKISENKYEIKPQSKVEAGSVGIGVDVNIMDTPSDDIISELNKLGTFKEKLEWLKNNNLITPIILDGKRYNAIDYSDRVMVMVKIGKYNIPFYISTGKAGKKNVKAGNWYAVFGIGESGWINKGSEELINKQYNYPLFQKFAKILNEGVGNIQSRDNNGSGKLKDGIGFMNDMEHIDQFNAQMNLPITPAKNNQDSETFWANVKDVLDLVYAESKNISNKESQVDSKSIVPQEGKPNVGDSIPKGSPKKGSDIDLVEQLKKIVNEVVGNKSYNAQFMAATNEELKNEFTELSDKRIQQIKTIVEDGYDRETIVDLIDSLVNNEQIEPDEAKQVIQLYDKLKSEEAQTEEQNNPKEEPSNINTNSTDDEFTKMANAFNDAQMEGKFGTDALDVILGKLQDTDLDPLFYGVRERIKKDSNYLKKVKERILTTKHGSEQDQAALLYDLAGLKANESSLIKDIIKIQSLDSGSFNTFISLHDEYKNKSKEQVTEIMQRNLAEIQNEMSDNWLANRLIGRAASTIFRLRQLYANKDMSLASMEEQYKASKGIDSLTDEQKNEVSSTYNKIRELEQKRKLLKSELDKAIEDNINLAAENENLKKLSENSIKQTKKDLSKSTNEKIKSSQQRINEAKERIRKLFGKLNSGFNPIDSAILTVELGKIAAEKFYQGAVKFREIVQQVWDDIQDISPDLTLQQVREHLIKNDKESARKYYESSVGINLSNKELSKKVSAYRKVQKDYAMSVFNWQKDRRFDMMARRPFVERWIDRVLRWQRFAILSYPSTIVKLLAVVGQQLAFKPLKVATQLLISSITPKSITQKQIMWGSPSAIALGKYYSAFIRNMSFANLKEQFSGIDTKEIMYGDSNMYEEWAAAKGILEIPGRSHGYIKSFIKNPEFQYAHEMIVSNFINKMIEINEKISDSTLSDDEKSFLQKEYDKYDVTNEDVMEKVNTMALNHGKWSILMNDNEYAKRFQKFADKKNIGTALIRSEVPIIKIPLNYISRYFAYKYGLIRAIVGKGRWESDDSHFPGIIELIYKRTSSLTDEQADQLGKALNLGTIGAAFLALGFWAKDCIVENEDGSFDICGHRVSKNLIHSPEIESMLTGASMANKHDGNGNWIKSYIESEIEVQKKNPFVSMLESGFFASLANAIRSRKSEDTRLEMLGDAVSEKISGMLIPGAIKQPAQWMDTEESGIHPFGETKPRYPKAGNVWDRFIQRIELGIPKLRENVPTFIPKGFSNKLSGDNLRKANILMEKVSGTGIGEKSIEKLTEAGYDEDKLKKMTSNELKKIKYEDATILDNAQAFALRNKFDGITEGSNRVSAMDITPEEQSIITKLAYEGIDSNNADKAYEQVRKLKKNYMQHAGSSHSQAEKEKIKQYQNVLAELNKYKK